VGGDIDDAIRMVGETIGEGVQLVARKGYAD
jgi:hypothetical protein